PRTDDDGNLVAHDELLGRVARLRGIGLVVLDDELERTAEDAALGVDPLHRDLGAIGDVGAGGGDGPGQRLDHADLDGLLRLRLESAGGENSQEGRHDSQYHDLEYLHEAHSSFAADGKSPRPETTRGPSYKPTEHDIARALPRLWRGISRCCVEPR